MGGAPSAFSYYSRKEVQQALLEISKFREVVGVCADERFGKRPNVLSYAGDVLQMVKEGVVSFHGSVERWSNPMSLSAELSKAELDALRTGWDVLIDVDVKDFELAKLAAQQIIECFKDHGACFGIKFTGGSSFHLAIPFEALPKQVDMQPTAQLYPSLLEKVVSYIKWYIRDQLKQALLSMSSASELAARTGKPVEEVATEDGLDPFKLITLDVFGSRHLFRLPYSLHERTGLVSLPFKPSKLKHFQKEWAMPESIEMEESFLPKKGSAETLIIEAVDWAARHGLKERIILPKPVERPKRSIAERYFPPCIQCILQGLCDGRKRSLFVLINFLRCMGWEWDMVERKLQEWNERNTPALRSAYLRTQLRWHAQQTKEFLPPNCDHPNFYREFGVCKPDELCKRVKNPVNYPWLKLKWRP